MFLVKNNKPLLNIYISAKADERIVYAAESVAKSVYDVTGANLKIEKAADLNNLQNALVLCLKSDIPNTKINEFKEGYDKFIVEEVGTSVYVVGETSYGTYFGAHDLLEKNMQIIWCRGAEDLACEYIKADEVELKKVNYSEASPFPIRCYNACGRGTTNKDHDDRGTVEYLGKNKTNAIFHLMKEEWRKYGVFCPGVYTNFNNLHDCLPDHPEYLMASPSGEPMTKVRGSECTVNFYNGGVVEVMAQKIAKRMEEKGIDEDVLSWIMPDDPYFGMMENGVKLHELPFTADDGTVVYPEQKNYKSTVHYNFMNRLIKRLNEIRPNSKLLVLAYMYAEECPAIEVDERLTVALCPILTNDKYAYTDTSIRDNDDIRRNILDWRKKTNNLGLYMYWQNFDAAQRYSRPSLSVMKEDLLWFKELKIDQLIVEARLDCTKLEEMTSAQKLARNGYMMNELYNWGLQKLMWNPELDEEELIDDYCRIVYKECCQEMKEYFNLLKEGWDKKHSHVWYATGCDVYYYQFVVLAGINKKLREVLGRAKEKATTPSVVEKITFIHDTVMTELEKYENFVRETANVVYVEGEDVLSKHALDYVNNPDSVWNKAQPLTVLRNYQTMKFYPEEAKFSCRILCDNDNIYFGFTIFDDQVVRVEELPDGHFKMFREDGNEVVSYTETYIGGNHLNQTKYYGYISGWQKERGYDGQYYENAGSPVPIPSPEGLRDVKFCSLSEDKEKRYYFHVQVIPIEKGLESNIDVFMPYGSFVYYTNRFGRAGWMGYGLWSKANFSAFNLQIKDKKQ